MILDILIYIKNHEIMFTLIFGIIAFISVTLSHLINNKVLFVIACVSLISMTALLPLRYYTHKEILKEEKTISNITYLEMVKIDKKDINYHIYDNTRSIEEIPNDIRKPFLEYILTNKKDKPVLSTKFENFEYIILYNDGEQQTFKLSDIQDDVVKQYLLFKNFNKK